jgi:glutamine synthetase
VERHYRSNFSAEHNCLVPWKKPVYDNHEQDALAAPTRYPPLNRTLAKEDTEMQEKDVCDAKTAMDFIKQHGIDNIKLAVTDIDGILRGKYVSRRKFEAALAKGFGFCDVIFGWDSSDELYQQDSFTGWGKGFADAWASIDPASCRALPTEDERAVMFLADFNGDRAAAVCPRSLLKKLLTRLEKRGYTANAAAEFEFFLFNETPASVRQKDYRQLQPITPDNFGYSILRSSTHADIYHQILDTSQSMGMPVEGLHTETGPGVLEAALEYCDALRAADNAVLFKTFVKVLAQRNQMMANFMAKWSNDYPGQSGHLHVSLKRLDGSNAFYDVQQAGNMSDEMRWFIGGQQQLMPELLSMVASSCNSYTRLVPGFWAPTAATWGVDNRTCALRAIPGSASSQRVEYRVAAADINPYLALAAAIGSGLWGIEQQCEPGPPTSGNAYDAKTDAALQLPQTLTEAASRLRQSTAARELFGDAFVEHYAYSREWEDQQQRKAVTNWQLRRYFEII